MFAKIEALGDHFALKVDSLEAEWFNVHLSKDRTYVELRILGLNKVKLASSMRFFTHVYYTSNDAGKYGFFAWMYTDLMEAYGLHEGDFLWFFLYEAKKIKTEVKE